MFEPSDSLIASLYLVVALIAFIAFLIFAVSYRRVRSQRLLLTTLAFFIFFVKALFLSMHLFIPGIDDDYWVFVAGFMDLVIIGLIVLALGKKT